MFLQRRTKGPFRLRTPSISSKSGFLSDSSTSSSSSAPSRAPSVLSSATSTTSEDEPILPSRQDLPADDTDVPTDPAYPQRKPRRRAKFKGNYSDHFLAPPTPQQLRRQRKRKPRKLPYTFVRQRTKPRLKKELFLDPNVKQYKIDKKDRVTMTNVAIPEKQPVREEYSINTSEFHPVKVLSRVYKPTLRRRRRQFDPLDEGIGIGGYIIRFADGHEHCFPIDKLNAFLERYPGLEELIEEFEHLSLAREDDDGAAVAYFKRQRMVREKSALHSRDTKDDVKSGSRQT